MIVTGWVDGGMQVELNSPCSSGLLVVSDVTISKSGRGFMSSGAECMLVELRETCNLQSENGAKL